MISDRRFGNLYYMYQRISTLCPPSSTVQNISFPSPLVGVRCDKGNMTSIIAINPDGSNAYNLSLDFSNSGISNMTNYLNRSQVFLNGSSIIMDSPSLPNGVNSILYLMSDLQSPSLTIPSPLSGNTYTSNYADVVILGDEPLSSCNYSDNGGISTSISPTGVNYIFNSSQVYFSQGSHNLGISCNDTSGNWNFVSTSFTIDTRSPTQITTANTCNSMEQSLLAFIPWLGLILLIGAVVIILAVIQFSKVSIYFDGLKYTIFAVLITGVLITIVVLILESLCGGA